MFRFPVPFKELSLPNTSLPVWNCGGILTDLGVLVAFQIIIKEGTYIALKIMY